MPKQIAILGGGMASLSAALELTDYPDWQQHYTVTLYQMGWRLGGKTSTGRGPSERIEEHGIHILQGWYDTTFRLLRAVYAERAERGLDPDSPLQDLFADGLDRNDTTLMTEYDEQSGTWSSWPLIFPQTAELPGESGPLPPWQLVQKGLGLMLEFALGSPYEKGFHPIQHLILDHFFPHHGQQASGCLGSLAKPFQRGAKTSPGSLPEAYRKLVEALHLAHEEPDADAHAHLHKVRDRLGGFVTGLEGRMLGGLKKTSRLRRIILGLNVGYYLLKGTLEDVFDPESETFNYAAIDHLDFREWLAGHGAPEWVTHSVLIRFFYTGTFSNLVNDRGGSIAAGTALQFLVQSIGYKGSFVFQFRYGTGDGMIMPIYQVLKARGVRFEFFQRVEEVEYAAGGQIERIRMQRQVKGASDYDPVKVLPDGIKAWPNAPLYDRLDPGQAARLREGHVNLEDPWTDWDGGETYTLSLGADFDEVVFGIPVGCIPHLCPGIVANRPEWRRMVEEVRGTPTQSAQLWLTPTLEQLGFRYPDWGLPEVHGAPNVVVYENPMYSWLDSTLVIEHEHWPAGRAPGMVAYYTGPYVLTHPLPPYADHGYPGRENAVFVEAFRGWLRRNMAFFWPAGATPEEPAGLNYALLYSTDEGAGGEERFAQQYYRLNVRPTDQYTLSLPGSGKHRLKADASGFDNLWLCGDWIDFGINVGYIDGTIQSGQQAAQALRTRYGHGGHKDIWGPKKRESVAGG